MPLAQESEALTSGIRPVTDAAAVNYLFLTNEEPLAAVARQQVLIVEPAPVVAQLGVKLVAVPLLAVALWAAMLAAVPLFAVARQGVQSAVVSVAVPSAVMLAADWRHCGTTSS